LNTVSMVDLNGHVRATATYTPAATPQLGCMGAVLPVAAHVAAGKVYFSDATGEVRSLAPDGTVARVTTFPVTSGRQMLSFAVSPDGSRIVGGVFTVPTNVGCGLSTSGGGFDAYKANAGSSPQLVYHESWAPGQDVMAFTGWDAIGPIGTYPTV